MDFEINENSERRYMHGWINQIIRLYYYFKEGVNQLTGLRTLGYALIGIAGVLAIEGSGTNYWIIVLIGLFSIPPLTLIGWMWVVRARKSEEYYQYRYLSPFGRYNFQLSEAQLKELKELNKNIEILIKKITGSN